MLKVKANTIEQYHILQFLQKNFFMDALGIMLVDRNRIEIQNMLVVKNRKEVIV